ncbi:pollen-specific leucine-rich repeat extensin-like protein 3 [Triticum aestivum]|uniref:pollen-specific leucine-rich repeat extensin-like protein 3 n=1 Tax=Triticum aestivum TaxID=4565 RepID=UPI001D016FF7|nr:pollen-specific leucine-rich repeat extensin-like protein 3 [Triticum aestivum]
MRESKALKLAFKAAAVEQPASADTLVPKGAVPSKKKQLFTQDKAETNKVPVDEDGSSGATFTIGANLKPEQEEALVKFLHANKEVFAWESDQLAGQHQKICLHPLPPPPSSSQGSAHTPPRPTSLPPRHRPTSLHRAAPPLSSQWRRPTSLHRAAPPPPSLVPSLHLPPSCRTTAPPPCRCPTSHHHAVASPPTTVPHHHLPSCIVAPLPTTAPHPPPRATTPPPTTTPHQELPPPRRPPRPPRRIRAAPAIPRPTDDGSELLLYMPPPNPMLFISMYPPDPVSPRPFRWLGSWWGWARSSTAINGDPFRPGYMASGSGWASFSSFLYWSRSMELV